jgi:hypothetical protein
MIASLHFLSIKQTSLNIKLTVLLIIGTFWIQAVSGQDTVRYYGILSNGLIYESFELYSDSTFKWQNEYDLSWQEFGSYERKGNKLTLNHYIKFQRPFTMRVTDSIAIVERAFRITNYEFSDSTIFKLNDQNKRVRKIKDNSLRKKWSWLFGHWHGIRFKTIT